MLMCRLGSNVRHANWEVTEVARVFLALSLSMPLSLFYLTVSSLLPFSPIIYWNTFWLPLLWTYSFFCRKMRCKSDMHLSKREHGVWVTELRFCCCLWQCNETCLTASPSSGLRRWSCEWGSKGLCGFCHVCRWNYMTPARSETSSR